MNSLRRALDGNEMRLVVEVKARVEWRDPPATKEVEIMREIANTQAAAAADELRDAVQLLVAILLTKRHL